jgi:hypothetical protein
VGLTPSGSQEPETRSLFLAGQEEQAAINLFEPRVFGLGIDLAKDRSVHGSDRSAESLLTWDRLICKARLCPQRGSGWQSV